MTVLTITTGLGTGGAERVLTQVAVRAAERGIRMHVVSLGTGGPFADELRRAGVPVDLLSIRAPQRGAHRLARLFSIARTVRPSVVQGWMYHGNLAALAVAMTAPGRPALAWSIRQSLADFDASAAATRRVIAWGARLSRACEAIVYNSEDAARQHERLGYRRSTRKIVPNGFDLERFREDRAAGARLRDELGVLPHEILVGYAARHHPVKDHASWIEALGRLADRGIAVRGVLAGPGTEEGVLAGQIASRGLAGRVHPLGDRSDIEGILAGLDIAASSSRGEGFPNFVGEAMACGVPCVATDVGATAELLGDTGILVRPGDPEALAEAMASLVTAGRDSMRALGRRGRARIAERFDVSSMADRFAELWLRTARRR